MPDLPTLFTFLGASLIVTIAPGPDNLMVLAHSLARGRQAGFAFALGCTLGCMTHILWATLGVSAALLASPKAFTALKWLGAAYLAWMAISAWRARPGPAPTAGGSIRRPWLRDVSRGFVANAINPKVALFFLAFMPQFIHPDSGPVTLQMLTLGGIFMAQTIVVFGSIAVLAGRIGQWMQKHPRMAPWLDRFASLVFLALAARLVAGSPSA